MICVVLFVSLGQGRLIELRELLVFLPFVDDALLGANFLLLLGLEVISLLECLDVGEFFGKVSYLFGEGSDEGVGVLLVLLGDDGLLDLLLLLALIHGSKYLIIF